MPLRSVQNSPAVAQDTLNLPGKVPDVPDDVITRFASMGDWDTSLQTWWNQIQQSLQDTLDSVAGTTNVVYQNVNNVSAVQGTLAARITTETSARIAGDAALASDITTVSSLAGSKAKISVQSMAPASPAVNDLWLDTSDTPPDYKFWDGAAWDLKPDGTLAAAISTEATTRAGADGFLSGKYTVTVVAGNVITGFNITSSTGGGTNVSNVSFTAGSFNIYDGTSSYPIFATSTGTVALAGTLVVNTSGKVYIGTGNYSDAGTPFYVDSVGKFSLGGSLTWDGTTLTVSGNISVTGGNAAKTDFSNVTAGYAVSPTVGGAATSIVSQGALATQSTANYFTQITNPPTNSSGGIIVSPSPSSAGLYLGSTNLGYYSGSAWTTYMDSSGNFFLGGTGGALQWSSGTLTITGNIVVTGGTAATTNFSNVTANYASSPSVNGAATSIVSQGALATQSTANYNSQLTGQPTNSAGGIIVSPSPSSAGLYLGSTNLGYYSGSTWTTYMDSSGNFYLGGTGGALQWNAGAATLQVAGTIVGTAGYFGSSSNAVSITTAGLSVGNTGAIAGGQTAYNTGTGFWMGYQSGVYSFSIGSSTNSLTWNGTVLEVVGTIVGSAGYFGNSTNAVSITSAGLSVGTSGAIAGGQSAYNTGAGFWLGYQSGAYGLSIGDGSNNRLLWNGTALLLQMTGTMVTTSTILNTDSTSATTWQGDPGINVQGFYAQHNSATGGINLLGVGSGIGSVYMARASGTYSSKSALSANSIVGRINYAPYDGSSWSINVRTEAGISANTSTPYYAIEVGPTPIRTVFNYDGKVYFGQSSFSPNSGIYSSPYVSDALANLYRSATSTLKTDGSLAIAGSLVLGGATITNPINTDVAFPGIIRFGTFTVQTTPTITGYLECNDAAGNLRRLVCCS